MERHGVDRRKPHPMREPGATERIPCTISRRKSGAVLETAAVAAVARMGAEKFVAEIAVAMLYIDKVEAQLRTP